VSNNVFRLFFLAGLVFIILKNSLMLLHWRSKRQPIKTEYWASYETQSSSSSSSSL